MKLFKAIAALFLFTLLYSACGDGEDPIIEIDPPLLVSSSPSNGSNTVFAGENQSIVLIFDQNIVLEKKHKITLNGVLVSDANASFRELSIKTNLHTGTKYKLVVPANTLKGPTGVYAAAIEINFETYPAPEITESLVTSNPSPEAVKLYDFLKENYGKKIISGTMSNVAWNTNEAEWVYKHTGKYPALACFDYIHLPWSPANWIDYGNLAPVKSWWNAGGIISAGWHWTVPASEANTDLNSMTYEPGKTTFRAKNALLEGTWENRIMKADLEKIAAYLLLLKNENIPVLWRPLHEAAGNIYEYNNGKAWFWWGYDGGDVYKQLWIYMFDFFQAKGLNNLIWVWTTQTKDDAFYPGDEYVDIIGRDLYDENATKCISQYETITQKYGHKLVALSECGDVGNVSEQWNKGAHWSWFMPWYDHTRTNNPEDSEFQLESHEHASISWWKDAFSCNDVITRDQLPNFK